MSVLSENKEEDGNEVDDEGDNEEEEQDEILSANLGGNYNKQNNS